MRQSGGTAREGFLAGDIVVDDRKKVVGKLLEIRQTPIFKDQVAILETFDGMRVESVWQCLRKATFEETQLHFKAAGLFILRQRMHRDAAMEGKTDASRQRPGPQQ